MGVRLTPDEQRQLLAEADVGILSTLRRDGSPLGLPMWFVVVDDQVCFRTRANGRKVARLERDPRVSFVVDRGAAWAELAAVIVSGRAELAGPDLASRIDAALAAKYAGRTPPEHVPERTRAFYDVPTLHYRIVTEHPPLTWDNAKLVGR